MLSAAGAIGVAPFAVIRILNGEWLLGLLDIFIVVGLCVLGMYVYRTREVRAANIALAAICVSGMVLTVYIKGLPQIFWAYPVMMAIFYLLKPREAIAVSTITIAVLLPALVPKMSTIALTTVFITLWVTNAFAYAFAALTSSHQQQLLDLIKIDPLTGAGNRRALTEKMTEVIHEGANGGPPVSLVMIDVDHFKRVNDLFGHARGDETLIKVTEIIQNSIRETDSLYRIGGEEFVVVSEGEGLQVASRLGEQLRRLIESNKFIPDQKVTVSLGVAELHNKESSDDWLRRADNALYAAKRAGRNQLRVAT